MNISQAVEKIKREIPILEVWNDELGTSHPVGETLSIPCPFHGDGKDETTSAKAYDDSNKVWCWACAKIRDQIDVVRLNRNIPFKEAVAILCQRYFNEELKLNGSSSVNRTDGELPSRANQKLDFLEQVSEQKKREMGWRTYYEVCYATDYLRYVIKNSGDDAEEMVFKFLEKLEEKVCRFLAKTKETG